MKVGLVIYEFQSPAGRRGMGRVQHAKIFDEQVTQYLDSVFGDLQPSLPFFPGGPSVFMSRWSRLLAALQIPMHYTSRIASRWHCRALQKRYPHFRYRLVSSVE